MPAWTSYEQQPDGRYRFVDDQGGELYLLPSPSVDAARAEIDARNAPPPAPAMQQPLAPEAMPDKIVAIDGPKQAMQLAADPKPPPPPAPPGLPPGPMPPPAALPDINGPITFDTGFKGVTPKTTPSLGDALKSQGITPNQNTLLGDGASIVTPGGGKPAPAAPGATPATPATPIVRAGGGADAPTPGNVAAGLYSKAAEAALHGSPGVFTPGGTFPTGKTVQFAPGPDPDATKARERAEKKLGEAQSDLIYVEARKQQEQAELAQAEAVRAQERQKQLQELQAREQEKLAPIFEEIDAKRQDLAASKLDPDKLINEMGSARQALLGVAMALGGFGKALAGEDGPPMAMQLWKEAVANDIANQKYAIEKKRADISTLGQVYQLAKERFNDERMAQEAAYLAGLEVYKAKLTRTVAEADAAMGVETQYDENGQIVAGAPYAMRAKAALAALAVEQAKIRESLSQQAAGQVAQQYVTTQDKVTGGSGPNYAKAAELMEKAAKAGEGGAQQVTYGKQKFKLGSFVEQGEGKKLREDLGDIEATKREVAILEKELRDNPVGSRTYDASRIKGLVERVTSKANVILGQGAKGNEEAKRWEAITSGVLTNGVGAVKDMHTWLDDMARNKLDQVNATPATQGSRMPIPQAVQDAAAGKKVGGGGGIIGLPKQAGAPSAPVVRASGAKASPLDRTGAALVQASTAGDEKAKAKAVELANKSLREALAAKQIGPGEYKVALQMARDGQYDELLDFLGRMRGTVSTTPQPITPEDQAALARSISAQVALGRVGLAPFQTQAGADKAMGVGAPVTTTISTKIGKPKGKGR